MIPDLSHSTKRAFPDSPEPDSNNNKYLKPSLPDRLATLSQEYFRKSSEPLLQGWNETTLPNGSFYKGNFLDGKLDGHGCMIQKNSTVYKGNWKQDKRHGLGELRFPNGTTYVGNWKEDAPQKETVHIREDGSLVHGRWEGFFSFYQNAPRSLRKDSETRKDSEGTVWTGRFEQDKLEGYGKKVSRNKIYEGDFHKGKREGFGTSQLIKDTLRSVFHGIYHEDEKHGLGTIDLPDNTTYIATWEKGVPEGQAILITPDGFRVHGAWTDDGKFRPFNPQS